MRNRSAQKREVRQEKALAGALRSIVLLWVCGLCLLDRQVGKRMQEVKKVAHAGKAAYENSATRSASLFFLPNAKPTQVPPRACTATDAWRLLLVARCRGEIRP